MQAIRDHVGDGTNLTEAGGDGDHLTEAGGDGDHLTAVVWNSDWDTEVQSEVDDALVANNLDHLCKTVTAGADMTTEVADNTILSRILANGDTSAFVPSTDGLQPIRDHIGDGTNLTEAGGDGDHLTEAGGDGDHLVEVAPADGALVAAKFGADCITSAKIADNALANEHFAAGALTSTEVTSIGSNDELGPAEVNTEVDNALDTAIPGTPTADSINEWITVIKRVVANKMEITEASGNTVVYKDDNTTAAYTVNSAFTTDATTTTRLQLN
jgi:hypothetical protein